MSCVTLFVAKLTLELHPKRRAWKTSLKSTIRAAKKEITYVKRI